VYLSADLRNHVARLDEQIQKFRSQFFWFDRFRALQRGEIEPTVAKAPASPKKNSKRK